MKTSQKGNKGSLLKEIKDSFENIGDDLWQDSQNAFKNSMSDINSQLFGANESLTSPEFPWQQNQQEKKEPKRIKRTEVVFNYLERQEQSRLNQELSQLMKEVKKEVDMLKLQDKALVNDISKLAIAEIPKNAGIYHLRFLEFIIKLLRSIRQKITEGRLWLQTSFEKKNKKKFWKMAKSKGTKFSMSKELTQANMPG